MKEEGPGIEPNVVAKADQAGAQLRAVGQMYAALYKSLLENGVPEGPATQIVCAHIGKFKA